MSHPETFKQDKKGKSVSSNSSHNSMTFPSLVFGTISNPDSPTNTNFQAKESADKPKGGRASGLQVLV